MINYELLEKQTSKEFVTKIKLSIDQQNTIREVIRIEVSHKGDVVCVEYLTGWDGKFHALWTHWFYIEDGLMDTSVINYADVGRFLQWTK